MDGQQGSGGGGSNPQGNKPASEPKPKPTIAERPTQTIQESYPPVRKK